VLVSGSYRVSAISPVERGDDLAASSTIGVDSARADTLMNGYLSRTRQPSPARQRARIFFD
jgi:hypothetical protein